MKKYIVLLVITIIAVSCSSIKVSSDFDKKASFSSYKTYAYAEEALQLAVNDLNKNRLFTAIDGELAAKGFKKVESNPDILINIYIKAEQKQTATATTSGGYGYGYGYRYGGWGGGTTTINYDTYTDGTLFVDMIDAAKKQLVWEGRGTKTLNPDSSQEQREKNINYAVKQIFMQYPPKF